MSGCKYTTEKQIDSYGVDHSGFSLRDEIAYQIARTNQEEQLEKSYNNLGISKNYPQFGNSFWGGNSANNYGFGTSNIEENIDEMQNRPLVPLTEAQKAKSRGFFGNLDGVGMEALEGLGKGVLGGTERGLNSLSLGSYGYFVDGYEERQNELKSLADQANLTNIYNRSNLAIDIGSSVYGGSKIKNGYDASKKGIQAIKYFIGKMK